MAHASHAAWAGAFLDFAWSHAFGQTTTKARREHMHSHNALVIEAAKALDVARKACAVYEMALDYVPTPASLNAARDGAMRNLRAVEKAARLAIDAERRVRRGEI